MKIVYLVLLFCVVSTTGQSRIARGEKATKKQFPYFAQLRMSGVDNDQIVEYTCGALLINERWLLSAAHCFVVLNLKHLQIDKNMLIGYMGSNVRYSKKASKNFVRSVALHSDFTVKFDATGDIIPWKNDIALVCLKKKYTLNKYIKLIQLPEPIRDFKKWMEECKTVTVVGIGMKKPQTNPSEKPEFEKFLMYSKERLKPFEEFVKSVKEQFPKEFQEPDVDDIDHFNGLIITQKEWLRGHTMPGDSGGPAICYRRKKPILYGITSMVTKQPTGKNASFFGFYERVDKHLTFIQSRGKNWKKHNKKRGVVVKPIHN